MFCNALSYFFFAFVHLKTHHISSCRVSLEFVSSLWFSLQYVYHKSFFVFILWFLLWCMHVMLGFYFNTYSFVLLFLFSRSQGLLQLFTSFTILFFIVSIFVVCVCLCWYNFLYPSQFIVVLLSCSSDLFTFLPCCYTFQSQLHHT